MQIDLSHAQSVNPLLDTTAIDEGKEIYSSDKHHQLHMC
jgi:hypothetical protein